MAESRMANKITPANAGVSPKKVATLEGETATLTCARVFGMITGIKETLDPRTDQVFKALQGEFMAVHPETDDEVRSGVLYLPSGIHDTFVASAEKLDDGGYIRFGVELRVKKAKNAAGYEWFAVNLLPKEEVDPLDELRQLAAKHSKALPGPAGHKAEPESKSKK